MIINKLLGEYFKRLRIAWSLTYESALAGLGLPIEDKWISRLKEAEEKGIIKNRFFNKIKAFYGVTDETLNSIVRAADEHRARNTDSGRFASFIKWIIEHRDLILATPKYSNISIKGVCLQSPYFGGGPLYLGALLKLWADEELLCKCDNCSGNVYMLEGTLILSNMTHCGQCIECGRYYRYCSNHPQFKRNFLNAWNVLAKFMEEKTNDAPASIKTMLRDVLKDDEHYDEIVKQYHLDGNDDTLEEIEFEPGFLCFKGRKFALR